MNDNLKATLLITAFEAAFKRVLETPIKDELELFHTLRVSENEFTSAQIRRIENATLLYNHNVKVTPIFELFQNVLFQMGEGPKSWYRFRRVCKTWRDYIDLTIKQLIN